MAYPVPEVWTVSGTLNKNGVPFFKGKVYADNLNNGQFGAVTNLFGGPRFDMESIGGTKLAENLVSAAESYAARFAQRQLDAAKTKLQAELERRKKEWTLEDEVADAEVVEVEKQEVVNEIKTQQVEKKHKNIENEILRTEQVYEVLSEKFTNSELYIWLEKELGKVFRQYVNLLIDVAKMAERAYHFEIDGLMTYTPEFITNNYWESFYKGLLAPEKILLDLRRMEKAYLENDKLKIAITEPILIEEDLSKCISNGGYSIEITNLSSRLLGETGNLRILNLRVQVICDNTPPLYTRLFSKISMTNGNIWSASVATGLAFLDADKFNFSYQSDQYLPFEGISVSDAKFTISVKADTEINLSNAKLVLFVTYTT